MKGKSLSFLVITVLLLCVSISTTAVFADSASEPVTIKIAEHVADVAKQSPHVTLIVDAFMKANPDIKIEISGREVTEHTTQMTLLAGEDNLPDIIWLEQAVAKEFAENGFLYNLTDAMDEYGINENLLPGLVHTLTVDGSDYGIPSEIMMVGFFYNKAIFADYGIEEPVTYEEFMDVIKTLAENNITPIAIGSQSNFSQWAFEAMLARYGFFEKLDGLNSGDISWVNDDFINYFTRVNEMREANAFSADVATLDYFQTKQVFLAGNAAMFNTGAWDIAEFESSDISKEIGFFWGPTFSDGVGNQEKAIKASGGVYTVSSKAAEDPEKIDAIMKFFAFYYGEEGTKIIAEETHGLPCSKYDGEINAEENPVLAVMIEKLNDDWESCSEPFNSLSTNVAYGYFDANFGVINGVYTPEEAAQYVEDLHALER